MFEKRIHIPVVDTQIGVEPVVGNVFFVLKPGDPIAHQRLDRERTYCFKKPPNVSTRMVSVYFFASHFVE